MNQILIKPIITEKSMREATIGRFTFEVNVDSNKAEISAAVATAFKVNPTSVQTVTIPARAKRVGKKRMELKSSKRKKAIVTLKTGEKIDLFDVTEDHEHSPKSS